MKIPIFTDIDGLHLVCVRSALRLTRPPALSETQTFAADPGARVRHGADQMKTINVRHCLEIFFHRHHFSFPAENNPLHYSVTTSTRYVAAQPLV